MQEAEEQVQDQEEERDSTFEVAQCRHCGKPTDALPPCCSGKLDELH